MDDSMITIVIWLILGIVCAGIADAKGRRTWLWGLIGILGGIFSFLIIICLPKIVPSKKCPRCANELKVEALICHYCGHDFLKQFQKQQNNEG